MAPLLSSAAMTTVNRGDLGHFGVTGERQTSSDSAETPTDDQDLHGLVMKPPSEAQRALMRVFDIALAGVASVVFFIPCVLITVVVKLTSRGPVLFVQPRVGRNGELFGVYKFRTMVNGTHL